MCVRSLISNRLLYVCGCQQHKHYLTVEHIENETRQECYNMNTSVVDCATRMNTNLQKKIICLIKQRETLVVLCTTGITTAVIARQSRPIIFYG